MGERSRRRSRLIRVTAALRLGLWLLAFAYASLVCCGFFLARFGNMDASQDAGMAATTLAYLATPLAVVFALDRCLVAFADMLYPWGRNANI